MDCERRFHTSGPAVEKDRPPNFVLARGLTKSEKSNWHPASGVARNLYWGRGGKKLGVEIEGEGNGVGCRYPQPTTGLGEGRKLPSEAPAEHGFGAFSAWKNIWWQQTWYFSIFVTRKHECYTNVNSLTTCWYTGSFLLETTLHTPALCCAFHSHVHVKPHFSVFTLHYVFHVAAVMRMLGNVTSSVV